MLTEETLELHKSHKLLGDRIEFVDFLVEIADCLINIPPEDMDDEIAFAMIRISRFFAVDHCSLLEVFPDKKESRYLYTTRQKDKIPEALNASSHPWAYRRLVEKGEPIIISYPEDLPPEAVTDRAFWEKEYAGSMLLVPLQARGAVTHVLALHNERNGFTWVTDHMKRLRLLGILFAETLHHAKCMKGLMEGEVLLAQAESIRHFGSWKWDLVSDTHQWSDEFYRVFGLVPQECTATYEAFLDSIHTDDRSAVHEANMEAISYPEKNILLSIG